MVNSQGDGESIRQQEIINQVAEEMLDVLFDKISSTDICPSMLCELLGAILGNIVVTLETEEVEG